MISAYTKDQLENLRHQREAQKWLKRGIIRQEQYEAILREFPDELYHPKIAFRILLFLAGILAVTAGSGLFVFVFFDSLEDYLIIPGLLLAGTLFFVSEKVFIQDQKHFRSGLIQGIHFCAFQTIVTSLAVTIGDFNAQIALLSAALAFAISIRYHDRFALVTGLLLIATTVFMLFSGFEGTLKFIVPFILSGLFFGIYKLATMFSRNEDLRQRKDHFPVLETASLLLAYLNVNLFVVQEGAKEFLGLAGTVPLRWLFISLSLLIPAIYLVLGIRNKNRILLNTGLLTLGIGILTIRHYFSIAPPEFALTISGLILLPLAIFLIRKLKTPFKGFTSERSDEKKDALLQVLTAAASDQSQLKDQESSRFGGGSFGGGGAGSDY